MDQAEGLGIPFLMGEWRDILESVRCYRTQIEDVDVDLLSDDALATRTEHLDRLDRIERVIIRYYEEAYGDEPKQI
jgi:hypothetical protein